MFIRLISVGVGVPTRRLSLSLDPTYELRLICGYCLISLKTQTSISDFPARSGKLPRSPSILTRRLIFPTRLFASLALLILLKVQTHLPWASPQLVTEWESFLPPHTGLSIPLPLSIQPNIYYCHFGLPLLAFGAKSNLSR